jgi:hypothetical protein
MLSSWRMYEMHLALSLKAGCDNGGGAMELQIDGGGAPAAQQKLR